MNDSRPEQEPVAASSSAIQKARPDCPLCGSRGHMDYTELPDRFFGSPGSWNLRSCRAIECGLAWLDPLPSDDELNAAYSAYYTHAAPRKKAPLLRPIYDRMKRGFLARTMGYEEGVTGFERRLGFLARFLPEGRHQMEAACMHLPAKLRGRILEIGCGNGNILGQLAELGWEAWGLDLDPKAVEEACKRGATDVRAGRLKEQDYPSAHFDAIASVHALEHVPDPIGLFEECHRVLKPGGHLVVSTPNWECHTHGEFGAYWRGLEPPRHLHLFCRTSLRTALEKTGFEITSLKTTSRGAAYGYRTSLMAKNPETSPLFARISSRLHSLRVCGRLSVDADAGDELLAIATRR